LGTCQHKVDEKIKARLLFEVDLLVGLEFLNTKPKVDKVTDKEAIIKSRYNLQNALLYAIHWFYVVLHLLHLAKAVLVKYKTQQTKSEMKNYFRPNFCRNTNDINPFFLQIEHESLFLTKYFMAAVLPSKYGVFGPSHYYLNYVATTPKVDYKNLEMYEIKYWE
jgi:hypothetical protein